MIPLSRPLIGDEEVAAVKEVLLSGQLVMGPQVEAFEAEFARTIGTAHAIAVSNGTAALELALRGLGIGPGDEVVVPSFTFAATANAVRMVGANPIFADVDLESYCLSAETVRPLLGPRTAAVIVVHLYGNVADPSRLVNLCRERGIALIEDAAQALGATWRRQSVGALGKVGTFSFYPTKNITTGEGGMITTNDAALADRIGLLRNHGSRHRYLHEIVGTNARLGEIGAAIGRVQLRRLAEWQAQRRANAAAYDSQLVGDIITPAVDPDVVHAYHQYTVRSSDRKRLISALDEGEVGYGIYYETPCHRQVAFEPIVEELPNTDLLAGEVLSIPVRPDLSGEDLKLIVETVNAGVAPRE